MDYEKKYKEVLSQAKQVYKKPYIAHWDVMKGLIEHLFPEIEESEDERIKKNLLIFLDDVWHLGREANFDKWGKADCSDWIAWLEKAVTPTPQDWNDYKDKPVEVWNAYVKGLANGIERGKEAVKNHPQDYGLEKQGEQEIMKKPIWKHWKNGIAGNGEGKQIYLIKSGDSYTLSSCLGYECDYIELSDLDEFMLSEKQDKNHADKVEPKFHKGDWVACNSDNLRSPLRIVSVSDTEYRVTGVRGVPGRPMIEYLDRHYHLWTIQDAKCGDVLADGNLPFIFKKIDTNKYSYAYCGISVDDGFKIESDGESGEWTWMQDIKPATKEQRDLLFQKMNEAGYEWDAEKKELKELSHL